MIPDTQKIERGVYVHDGSGEECEVVDVYGRGRNRQVILRRPSCRVPKHIRLCHFRPRYTRKATR